MFVLSDRFGYKLVAALRCPSESQVCIFHIFDEVDYKIDLVVVFDYEKGLLVYKLGVEGKVFDEMFHICQDLSF